MEGSGREQREAVATPWWGTATSTCRTCTQTVRKAVVNLADYLLSHFDRQLQRILPKLTVESLVSPQNRHILIGNGAARPGHAGSFAGAILCWRISDGQRQRSLGAVDSPDAGVFRDLRISGDQQEIGALIARVEKLLDDGWFRDRARERELCQRTGEVQYVFIRPSDEGRQSVAMVLDAERYGLNVSNIVPERHESPLRRVQRDFSRLLFAIY